MEDIPATAPKLFSQLFSRATNFPEPARSSPVPDLLCESIDRSIVGAERMYHGPFGKRRLIHCDQTASGQPISFIENFVLEEVGSISLKRYTPF